MKFSFSSSAPRKTHSLCSLSLSLSLSERKIARCHAVVGATSAVVGAFGLYSVKPKDPTFTLISIDITSFKLNLPLLTVQVTHPNIAPIHCFSSTMSIFYKGCLLGAADVKAGSQSAKSCEILRLPAVLDGLQLAHHASSFVADVAKREMVLDAAVDVAGARFVGCVFRNSNESCGGGSWLEERKMNNFSFHAKEKIKGPIVHYFTIMSCI